jgi:hypothetical protein
MRLAILAGLLYWFGEPIRDFIEKRLELMLFVAFATIVFGFVLAAFVL